MRTAVFVRVLYRAATPATVVGYARYFMEDSMQTRCFPGTLLGLLFLLPLVVPASSSQAQVPSGSMRSGHLEVLTSPGISTMLFPVPPDSTFVLTSITIVPSFALASPNEEETMVVNLTDDSGIRWSWRMFQQMRLALDGKIQAFLWPVKKTGPRESSSGLDLS